jgi:hypothetical protein
MPDVKVRKFLVSVEEIHHEGGPVAEVPPRRGAVLAVIENPYAGAFHENIQPFMENLKPLGLAMAQKLLAALGGDPKSIEGYGKGAIVGGAGELEHAALWHAPGGYSPCAMCWAAPRPSCRPPRKLADRARGSTFPSPTPNASYVRSHFDAIEVGLTDAPSANEIVVALVMTTGAARSRPRRRPRRLAEIKGQDGLR